MSSSKKISQQELRRLMREKQLSRQQTNQSAAEPTLTTMITKSMAKKIDSPLAKYDANGRLSCIVCNEYLTSDHLWSIHITSKAHKNKIEEIKRKRLSQITTEVKKNVVLQSSVSKPEMKQTVKRKLDTIENSGTNQKIAKNVEIKVENASTVPMDVDEKIVSDSTPKSASIESGLPNDFFDEPNQMGQGNKGMAQTNEPNPDLNSATSSLPKGFFDDPIKDAKARKVVYKNPIDEQWEEFQKVIAEENNKSENIIEEDVEELQIERNIEEIEEQIANWIKVNEMQKKAEILHNHIVNSGVKQEESDSDVDDEDMNAFSDWRSRTALNPK